MQCAAQLGYFFPLFYSSQWIKLCLPYVVLGQLLNTRTNNIHILSSTEFWIRNGLISTGL